MSESEPKQRIDPLRPIIESAFYDAFGIAAIWKTQQIMAEHGFGEIVEIGLWDQKFDPSLRKHVSEFKHQLFFPDEKAKQIFLLIYSVARFFTEKERVDDTQNLSQEAEEEIKKIIQKIKDQQAQP